MAEPVLVSRSEAALLRAVTAAFAGKPAHTASSNAKFEAQPPTARIDGPLRERIAAAAIERLARSSILSDGVEKGLAQRPRYWVRHAAPALRFTDAALELLQMQAGLSPTRMLTIEASGDRLLALCQAMSGFSATADAAVALVSGEVAGDAGALAEGTGWWITGEGATLFEALQRDIGEAVARMAVSSVPPKFATDLAFTFTESAVSAGRLDLARWTGFAVETLAGTLSDAGSNVTPAGWAFGAFRPTFRGVQAMREQLLEIPGALDRVATWIEESRAVRYVDDGYDEAQQRLREWEAWGPAAVAAARVVRVQTGALEAEAMRRLRQEETP